MSSQQATTTLTQPAPKMTLKEKRMAREQSVTNNTPEHF